jgi:hypothetical protein
MTCTGLDILGAGVGLIFGMGLIFGAAFLSICNSRSVTAPRPGAARAAAARAAASLAATAPSPAPAPAAARPPALLVVPSRFIIFSAAFLRAGSRLAIAAFSAFTVPGLYRLIQQRCGLSWRGCWRIVRVSWAFPPSQTCFGTFAVFSLGSHCTHTRAE